jgi:RimJ/RimL family protein N-acetyltransferase
VSLADGWRWDVDVFPDVRLLTARLLLRPFGRNDIPAVSVGCADEVTQRWLPLPAPYDEVLAERWCTREAERLREAGDGIQLAMAERDGDRFVGSVCLKRTVWRAGVTELGYWTMPDARGRGYAAEAAARLARWALADTRIHRVWLSAATGNVASQRVARRAGFTFEGVARSAGFVHGGRVDLQIYSLIRGDPAAAGS